MPSYWEYLLSSQFYYYFFIGWNENLTESLVKIHVIFMYILPFCLGGIRYLFCINSPIYHILFIFTVNSLFNTYCRSKCYEISAGYCDSFQKSLASSYHLLWKAHKSQQLVLLEGICFILRSNCLHGFVIPAVQQHCRAICRRNRMKSKGKNQQRFVYTL